MSNLTKNDIRRIIYGADKDIYSHVIIKQDSFDYDYFSNFVKKSENVYDYIKADDGNMIKVMEVYNLSMDLEYQLKERRAFHPEYEEVKKTKNSNICDKALEFATIKHKGQFRKGDIPMEYIVHPINVAKLILKYKGNSKNIDVLVAASYLHDTLEDTNTSFYDLVNLFGNEVAYLVLELTSDNALKEKLGKEMYLSIKMTSMTNWALDIKLCDRLDNISGLENVDENFRNKYINESLYIIKYLIENRKLSKTHLIIINDILAKLRELINNFDLNYEIDDLTKTFSLQNKKLSV